MALANTVRDRVSWADGYLKAQGLQAQVIHYRYLSTNRDNEVTYETAGTKRYAVLERKKRLVRTSSGEERMSTLQLIFTKSFAVDVRDKFEIVGTGSTATYTVPTLLIEGDIDPATGTPYAPMVHLGA